VEIQQRDGVVIRDFATIVEMQMGNIALTKQQKGFTTGMGIPITNIRSIEICGIVFVPKTSEE
jgi:hypothetical protein